MKNFCYGGYPFQTLLQLSNSLLTIPLFLYTHSESIRILKIKNNKNVDIIYCYYCTISKKEYAHSSSISLKFEI